MLRDRFNSLINALKEKGELEFVKDVEEIIGSCSKYIDRVNAMEAALATARFTMEDDDYRQHIYNLDSSRRIFHNALIVNTKLLNRYCKLAEVQEIYTGNLESRIEIADFAMEVVKVMYETRKL